MIFVKTQIRKVFDIVKTKKQLVDEIKDVLGYDYRQIISNYFKQGLIKKRTQHYIKDDFDNIVYISDIFYDNIESHKICFEIAEIEFEKLIKAGFEVTIKIKSISDKLEI